MARILYGAKFPLAHLYTVVHKKTSHFYFFDNSGKY